MLFFARSPYVGPGDMIESPVLDRDDVTVAVTSSRSNEWAENAKFSLVMKEHNVYIFKGGLTKNLKLDHYIDIIFIKLFFLLKSFC